jgi:putative hydrolase of the HAD superfamily
MRLLIWDFDQTLGYREGGWTGALVDAVRRCMPHRPVSEEQIQPHLQSGFPWHTPDRMHTNIKTAEQWWQALYPVFERAFTANGFADSQARVLAREVRRIYPEAQFFRLFDDTLGTLDALTARGWTHFLLTNHVPELPGILASLGLAPRIVRVLNSAQTGYEKPHPQAFRNVLAACPGATSRWMIGNSFADDVRGAESVGIRAILVRARHPDARLQCDRLSEVIEIIERHGR